MIKPEMIPREVVEAASRSRAIWNEGDDRYWKDYAEGVEADLLAGLNAWPSAAVCHYTIADNEGYEMVLPLPFPKEAGE